MISVAKRCTVFTLLRIRFLWPDRGKYSQITANWKPGCYGRRSGSVAESVIDQQLDQFEARYRERHDDDQKYQRALFAERLAARLFDLHQDPVGNEVEGDGGDGVVDVLHGGSAQPAGG